MRISELSEVIEVTKISRQDQDLQTLVDSENMSPFLWRKVFEVTKLSFGNEFRRRFVNKAGLSKQPRPQAETRICSVQRRRF